MAKVGAVVRAHYAPLNRKRQIMSLDIHAYRTLQSDHYHGDVSGSQEIDWFTVNTENYDAVSLLKENADLSFQESDSSNSLWDLYIYTRNGLNVLMAKLQNNKKMYNPYYSERLEKLLEKIIKENLETVFFTVY